MHIRWRAATCFSAVSHPCWQTRSYSPYATQANERSPRTCNITFPVDLIEHQPSLDEVCVATEGYDGRRIRWGFWSFCDGAVISANRLGPFATYQEGHGDEAQY